MNELHTAIAAMLAEILDIDASRITPSTHVLRDLGAESIDLLELGVVLNRTYGIPVNDPEIFLLDLRIDLALAEEQGRDPVGFLKERYQALSEERIRAMLRDLEQGPVLQVTDIAAYVDHKRTRREAGA